MLTSAGSRLILPMILNSFLGEIHELRSSLAFYDNLMYHHVSITSLENALNTVSFMMLDSIKKISKVYVSSQ